MFYSLDFPLFPQDDIFGVENTLKFSVVKLVLILDFFAVVARFRNYNIAKL